MKVKYTSIHSVVSITDVHLTEAMLWLEGKRALEMGTQIRGRRNVA